MTPMTSKIFKSTGTADLTSASLTLTTALPPGNWRLIGVEIHASENITETVAVKRDNAAGANYDTELYTASMSAADDAFIEPVHPPRFSNINGTQEQAVITVTNANTTGSVFVSAYFEEVTA